MLWLKPICFKLVIHWLKPVAIQIKPYLVFWNTVDADRTDFHWSKINIRHRVDGLPPLRAVEDPRRGFKNDYLPSSGRKPSKGIFERLPLRWFRSTTASRVCNRSKGWLFLIPEMN